MRMMVRGGLVALVVMAFCGCGSKSNPTAPGCGSAADCSITLAGGVTGTVTCTSFGGSFSSAGNIASVDATVSGTALIGGVSQAVTVLIDIGFPGNLHTGIFKNTDASAGGDVILQGPGGNSAPTWEALAPATGSYTLNVTCTGNATNNTTGTTYTNVHGTLTATLPATGNGATGTVTLTASF